MRRSANGIKVKDLIEILKEQNPDAYVKCRDENGLTNDVENVESNHPCIIYIESK